MKDEELRRRWFHSKPNRCQICGGKGDWRNFAVHHIVRFRRSDEPCNLLKLCGSCHDRCHDGWPGDGHKITTAMCCLIKAKIDPDEYDHERLEELYGGPIQ